MWAGVRRYPVALPVAIVLAVVGAWLWFTRIGPHLAETDDRQAIYDRFDSYSGAERVSTRRYEHTADGRPTGRYGLEVVYRLPDSVTTAEVLQHYRRQIPDGWSEASDQTCLAVMAGMPPAPSPAPGESAPSGPVAESFVLLRRGTTLTIFTDEADVAAGRIDGLTVSLSRTADGKFASLDSATYSCGAPEADRAAADFDAP